VAHRRAKLTPYGRSILVHRVLVEGWSVKEAAKAASVSPATVYKWVARFREEGSAGLQDRTSAPRRRPRALPYRDVQRILAARRRLKLPMLGHPRSTVYGVLRRGGVARLDHLDGPTSTPLRYERERPGELVHIDVKKLGRIRPGGGWRMLGQSTETKAPRGRGAGYDYLHAAVDDHSRYAYVEVHPDERGPTCAAFLDRAATHFASLGLPIDRVMTDQAKNYLLSRDFQATVARIGARHLVTRPYRPQTNGKVERFNRTALEEWAYVRLYRSNAARLKALPRWLETYNRRRPHTALGGRPPTSRLSTT
jgi:transposase InsO family protein